MGDKTRTKYSLRARHGVVARMYDMRFASKRSQQIQSRGTSEKLRILRRWGWFMSTPAAMFISLAYSAISSGEITGGRTLWRILGTSCELLRWVTWNSLTATFVPSLSITAGFTVDVRLYPRHPSSRRSPHWASRHPASSETLTGPGPPSESIEAFMGWLKP